jgi:acyl-CoA thioesterase
MIDAQHLAEHYVAIWNETDPSARRSAIAQLWHPDGRHYVKTLQVQGHDALQKRVAGSHEKNVRDAGYVFRAVRNAQQLPSVITFNWEMVKPATGEVVATGLELVEVAADGESSPTTTSSSWRRALSMTDATVANGVEAFSRFEFDVHTHVERGVDGTFDASLSEQWCARPGNPNGGYTLGLCLQALRQHLAHPQFPDPLVVSAAFLRPASIGPAQINTKQLRAGRRMATGEATLLEGGQQVMAVRASFADLSNAQGSPWMMSQAPNLPRPDRCVALSLDSAMPGATMAHRMEYRWEHLPGWATGSPGGKANAEFWMRFQDGRPADCLSFPTLVDAAAPVVLDLGEQDSSTVKLTVHVRAVPRSTWLACRASTRHVMGGYHEEDFEIWDAHGTLVAQSRQLAVLPTAPVPHTTREAH